MGPNGELHGPYWYARDAYAIVKYIGKALPEGIEETLENLVYAKEEIDGARRLLLEQAEALRRLQTHNNLTSRQRELIWDMGFGYCLVSAAAAPVEQDGGAR